ncbi:hypothetical protein KR222_010829, partial [Zaprionus bogoriensis]
TKRTPLALLLFTLCLSCSEIRAKPTLGFWQDVWNNAGETGKNIIDALNNATKEGVDAAKDAFEGLHNTNHQFLSDAKQINENLTIAIANTVKSSFQNLTSSLADSIQEFQSVIAKEKNFIKRNALKEGLAALQKLSATADALKSGVLNLKAQIGDSIVGEVNDALKDLKQWGEDELARVANLTNGEGVPAAKELIDGLIDSYNKQADSLQQFEKVKADYLEQLVDTIQEYQRVANDLVKAMASCKLSLSLSCKFSIDVNVEQLNSAISGLQALLAKGEELAKTAVYVKARAAEILAQLAKDKLAFDAKIAQLIADILAGRAASSSSSAPSADDESSSAAS